ncbi:MAG: hypothetical protein K2P70_08690 [Hyphomonadaceae bacterium]|jgi:hypothetical protein|nr:hypothetical protein [Hyphomonadaceae bacterium]
MKKLLVGAAAAAALIAPGVASADTQGAIDFTYGSNDFSYGDFDNYTLGGGIATDFSHGLRIQLDGSTTTQDWDGSSGSYSHGYAAAHLSGDLGGVNVGGFAGMLNYYGDGGAVYGVEARSSWNALSFDGYLAASDFNDNNYDGTHYGIGAAWFFSPNFALTGGVERSDINSFTDFEITELSLGGAYQFANNFEVFGEYIDTDGDRSSGTDYDGETLQIGLRMNIGGGTLQDNANGGLWGAARDISETYSRW